jgi:hypothetical protein
MTAARSACSMLMLLLLLAAAPAHAVAPMAVGIKGGLSAATWHGDLPEGPFAHDTRFGFGAGLSFGFGFNRLITLQPELLYVQKGMSLGEVTVTDPYGTPTGSAHVILAVSYLEMPILARVALPHMANAMPYVVLGPTIGMRGAQREVLTGDLKLSQAIHFVKETDFGAAFGIGAEMGQGSARFNVETRYTLGLTNTTESYYSDNVRNGALLVMVGVALHP